MALSTGASNFAREASGWLFIGCVVFASVYFFTDIRGFVRGFTGAGAEAVEVEGRAGPMQTNPKGGEVHIRAAEGGHFISDIDINGHTVRAVVDTGATGVSMSYEDARAAGFRLDEADFTIESQTANGTARVAPVTLDRVEIGDIKVRDVEAYVAEPGKLHQTLLGMSFLGQLSHVGIERGELVLVQ